MRGNCPKKSEIVKANAPLLAKLRPAEGEATQACWACGASELESDWPGAPAHIVRAHVVAVRHGGTNTPDNFFLLCEECHEEQPDGVDRASQEFWLLRHESRTTIDFRMIGETQRRIYERAKSVGIEPSEIATFIKSEAFKVKMGADPTNRYTLKARLAAFEACVGTMRSPPSEDRRRAYQDPSTGVGPDFSPSETQ